MTKIIKFFTDLNSFQLVGGFLVLALVFVFILMYIGLKNASEHTKHINEICPKDPTQWECQVYLAEKARSTDTVVMPVPIYTGR